jgi:hypothetical protein
MRVERDWRDLKQVLDLRPVCHCEGRIRVLLLACSAEKATGATSNPSALSD